VWAPWRDAGGDAPPLPAGAVESIAATVPADIRDRGRLVIGVNVPYAPMEFKNADGQLVGFDVELMNAVTEVLGLVPDYRDTSFDMILPSVLEGTTDVGMSSVTDTKAREASVDFVTYFQAGTQWAKRSGTAPNPNSPCGVRVGVAQGTLQETEELPRKSDQCVAAGQAPVEIVVSFSQDEVTNALIAGEVDAMSADSPVTGFAIKLSRGDLVPAGDVFDSAPYGWPVKKGSALAESLRLALEHLMESGDYRAIATMWGVERGMIDTPVINGATR
ncbi:MAG: ABC transporter substrate-binding protein, partial [Mycobacterium sp.]